MSTHKHIDLICVIIAAFAIVLTVLFMNGKALGITTLADEGNSDDIFTANDLNADWDTTNAAKITLSDSGSKVVGNGAYANGNDIYIVYAGNYVISGELSDGSIIINADGDDKIRILLDGVSVNSEDSAALIVEQAEKVFLTLSGENNISSGAEYGADAVSSGIDGAVYARDDLTINGAGALTVNAEYQHGIVCNDDLVIAGGDIKITAPADGIHANDSVRICDSNIEITAGDDGITASNDEQTSWIYVQSGNISIPSCYEGIEAISITVDGGTIEIHPTDDGFNANGYGANSAININGGEITVINENGRDADGLDSNGNIYINGGTVFISVSENSCALDCGSESGGVCEVTGGTVIACGGSSMAEGFSSASPQGFLMLNTSGAAGAVVTLKDDGGAVLLTDTIPCKFSSIILSTPELEIGDVCTVDIDGTETEVTIDNTSASGGFGGFGGNKFGGGFGNGGFDQFGNTESGMFGRHKGDKFGGVNGTGATTSETQTSTVSVQTASANTENAPTENGEQPTALPDGTGNGFQRPERPDGANGGTPPEMPNGGFGGMPPEFSQGETSANGTQPTDPQDGTSNSDEPSQDGASNGNEPPVPPNGTSDSTAQPTVPQDGADGNGAQPANPQDGTFGTRPDFQQGETGDFPNGIGGGKFGNMNGNTGNSTAQTDNSYDITREDVILLGISAIVLIGGCLFAGLFKRR